MYQPGSVLAGRYRLGSRIATGGMGEVWLATDQLLDREVAAKLVKPEFATDRTFRQRLHAEARAAAAVRNPHVVDIYDVGEDTDGNQQVPFIVMQLVGGTSLADLLAEGPLGAATTIDLLAQVGEALATAHACGVVHRDIKPANMVLDDDTGRVTVLDFGIARAADSAALTATGMMLGTARYISPEQVSGRPATAASDVYSLGVVAFQCLVGQPPFDAGSDVATALAHRDQPPPDLPAVLPAELRELVSACLAKSPEDRPPAAQVAVTASRLASVPAGGDQTLVMPTAPADGPGAVIPAAAEISAVGDQEAATEPTEVMSPKPPTPPHSSGARWLEWRRLSALAGAAVVVLLVLAVVGALTNGNGKTSASTLTGHHATTPTARAASDLTRHRHTVRVRADRYVGESFATAQQQFLRLGLVPAAVGGPAAPTATVVAVSPIGRVPLGHRITLTLLDPKPSAHPPAPKPKHHVPPGHQPGHGHGGHGPGGPGGHGPGGPGG